MALHAAHPGQLGGHMPFQANATLLPALHTPQPTDLPADRPNVRKPSRHTSAPGTYQRHATRQATRQATRHLVATPLDDDLVDVPVSMVVTSVLQADAFVSATPCSRGTGITGSPCDDISGLQQWLIQPAEDDDSFGEYTIAISSGRDECTQRFLGSSSAGGTDVALHARDDGSGRHRWLFKHVGETASGTPLYTIRLAGGKKDEFVYLGLERGATTTPPEVAVAYPPPARMRLYASAAGPRKRFALTPVSIHEEEHSHEKQENSHEEDDSKAPTSTQEPPDKDTKPNSDKKPEPDTKPKAESSTETRIPVDMTGSLGKLTKMSLHQIDVVLQLVSLPENSTPQWYKNYGYIEFLGDGRGFTATIFGACSGTGDLIMVFDALQNIQPRSDACDALLKYTSKLRSKRGDDIRGIEGIKPLIQKLGNDPAWQRAVWTVYVKLYWKFAMDFADKRGPARSRSGPVLLTPAARGFMLDTAINHGANMDSLDVIMRRMPAAARESKDERTWVLAFAEARRKLLASGYDNLDTSGTGHRCTLWAQAITDNPTLATPYKAFKGYWGSFTLQ